jgi:hypothetical protein
MPPKRISAGVAHDVPEDLRQALTSVNGTGGYYAARTQRVDVLD